MNDESLLISNAIQIWKLDFKNAIISEADAMIHDIKEETHMRRKSQKQPTRPSGAAASHRRQNDDHENSRDNRQQSTSRSHVIECRKVGRNGESNHDRGSVQKVEIFPRKSHERSSLTTSRSKPRQRHHTKENNLAEVSSGHSPSTMVKSVRPISARNSKANMAPKKPIRTRQTSLHPQELEAAHKDDPDINSAGENNLETVESEITTNEAGKPETTFDTEPERKQATKPVSAEAETTACLEKGDKNSDDEAEKQNDNLVKMLKKIDTQTLKRRLSLDKLDDLDTDDEVRGHHTRKKV